MSCFFRYFLEYFDVTLASYLRSLAFLEHADVTLNGFLIFHILQPLSFIYLGEKGLKRWKYFLFPFVSLVFWNQIWVNLGQMIWALSPNFQRDFLLYYYYVAWRFKIGADNQLDAHVPELKDREDIPLLLEGERCFKLVWMESTSPCNSLIGHSLKWRCCFLVWPISLLTKTSFDPLGRDQSSFRLLALTDEYSYVYTVFYYVWTTFVLIGGVVNGATIVYAPIESLKLGTSRKLANLKLWVGSWEVILETLTRIASGESTWGSHSKKGRLLKNQWSYFLGKSSFILYLTVTLFDPSWTLLVKSTLADWWKDLSPVHPMELPIKKLYVHFGDS